MLFVFLCKTEIKYYKRVSKNPYLMIITLKYSLFIAKIRIFRYSIICIDM